MSILDERALRRTLLAWYSRVKRDLPWRRRNDPYAIWISEIMLQQTRVAAVLPYFERFLALFPTVERLAVAPEQDVLRAWSGLGYYSRARNVLRAAGLIAAEREFPRAYDEIRALPGIGDYTAAAIASIAFGLPHAAVDGNALRVFSRLTADPGDIGSTVTRERLTQTANHYLARRRPGDFNQAIMELGATVCLPRAPVCPECPLSTYCRAFAHGSPGQFPVRIRKMQRRDAAETLLYIERRDEILLWQRAASSKRLAGFWELPGSNQLERAAISKAIGEFRHTIVNTTFSFKVMRASIRSVPPGFTWFPKKNLDELPLSTTAKKALRCLNKGSHHAV